MKLTLSFPPSANTARRWTPAEDEHLRSHYTATTHAQMGEALGRSAAAVRNRCHDLKLSKKIARHSEDTKKAIRAYYEAREGQPIDLPRAAKELGMSRIAVASLASKLSLTDASRPKDPAGAKKSGAHHAFLWRMGQHPRGMLGKKHSPETRKRFSEERAARYAAMTPEERAAPILKGLQTKERRGDLIRPRPNASWTQAWHTIGGKRHYFRSKWEVNYAHYLEWLKAKGEIAEWEYEPTTFWFEAIKRGTRSYTPDFRVTENSGKVAYHEIKGWMDKRSKTKLKRMAKYHPSVNLVLVDSAAYKKLNRQLLGLVPGWD